MYIGYTFISCNRRYIIIFIINIIIIRTHLVKPGLCQEAGHPIKKTLWMVVPANDRDSRTDE